MMRRTQVVVSNLGTHQFNTENGEKSIKKAQKV